MPRAQLELRYDVAIPEVLPRLSLVASACEQMIVRRDPEIAATHANLELEQLQRDVNSLVMLATTPTTRDVYARNWARFARWCQEHGLTALPAAPETVALYATHLVKLGRKYSTLRQAICAIGRAHLAADAGRPDRDERIRALMHGIGRTIGTRAKGASPLMAAELAKLVRGLGSSMRDTRDRALLLLGYVGAYRASDLAELQVEDLCFANGELVVLLPRSKEDQLGRGQKTTIPSDDDPSLCAVRAAQSWIAQAGLQRGPLFRAVYGSCVGADRIHPRTVTRAVQRVCESAGAGDRYSAHSLRAGFATDADANGWSPFQIQHQGRWGYVSSLSRYIDSSAAPARRSLVSGFARSRSRSLTTS